MNGLWFFLQLCAVFGILSAPPALAGEWAVGVGADNVAGRPGGSPVAAGLDVTGDALWRGGALSLHAGGGVEGDADGDLWIGVGPVIRLSLGPRWRVQLDSMPGAYRRGEDGNALGGAFQIRSRGGLHRRFGGGAGSPNGGAWLGVSFGHKSNANLASENPGVESLMLHWATRF